ncbi:hypothetical protein D3C85_1290300 [compost metagenome]
MIGRHGTGEPRAAITPGFEGLEHMPKLGMFNSALWSRIVAWGTPDVNSRLLGRTIRLVTPGGRAKGQRNMAP